MQVLDAWETWATIRIEISLSTLVFGWLYLTTPAWMDEFIAAGHDTTQFHLIVDDRMSETIAAAIAAHPNLTAYRWAKNRTMHDKTLIFPDRGISIIGTSNMTKGSYLLAQNRAVRIDSAALAAHLMNEWDYYRSHARLIRPRTSKETLST
jgi:phosphatidylserine/phosphatidylglycerophosphate/cardiolipin synthase-like enzyme